MLWLLSGLESPRHNDNTTPQHHSDLGHNKLKSLPDNLFQYLDELRELYVCVCWVSVTTFTSACVLNNAVPTHRSLANNELEAIPDGAFAYLPSTCDINITSNPCAQQPCGAGLKWFQSKQGVEFCASTSAPTAPQPDSFPWALMGGIGGAVLVLCTALGIALWCRFRKSRGMGPTKSLSDEELGHTTINPVANAETASVQMKVGLPVVLMQGASAHARNGDTDARMCVCV